MGALALAENGAARVVARSGITATEGNIPLEWMESHCQHVIQTGRTAIVAAGSGWFFAGAPLLRNKKVVGALCVFDDPQWKRRHLGDQGLLSLAALARQAVNLLDLKQLQKSREQLTEHIVHDLKNPLSAILANLKYAEKRTPSGDVREALTDTRGAADALYRMVLNLLDVGRGEDGLVARRGDVDMPAFLEQVGTDMRRRATENGQTLEVDAAGFEGGPVSIDSDLTRRLLENLVDNAFKYGGEGGIRVVGRSAGKNVRLEVCDRGRGVPVEFREKIFDRYAQLDTNGATHAHTSRGLGLAFCRMAAEAHGGRIRVEDNQPQGARFVVELPAR